jgi:hypothetical protein
MKKAKNVFIYALVDPTSNDIRYIGKSLCPKKRLKVHMSDSSQTSKVEWLTSLKENGEIPKIKILEITDEDHWPKKEKWWIKEGLHRGWPLTNISMGGGGNKRSRPFERTMNDTFLELVKKFNLPPLVNQIWCNLTYDIQCIIFIEIAKKMLPLLEICIGAGEEKYKKELGEVLDLELKSHICYVLNKHLNVKQLTFPGL